MRVLSLVPSWTETLVEAGVNVVGRTRFCLHPEPVKALPAVGGTKDVDWEKVRLLKPDLVLFDREENTMQMAQDCPFPWHATHVGAVGDMPKELRELAKIFDNLFLDELAARWANVASSNGPKRDPALPPALLKWITPPPKVIGETAYVIWHGPWMAAGPDTFIGSVMEWCGWKIWGAGTKYPKFDPAQLGENPLFLCSSEPFPFGKRPDVMQTLPGAVALLDGEKISWFGIRSLVYLESLLNV